MTLGSLSSAERGRYPAAAQRAILLIPLLVSNAFAADVAVAPRHLDEWIQQLGDPTYAAREAAEQALMDAGLEALDAIRAAQHHANPEIAMRAKQLNRRIQVGWADEHASVKVRQLLNDFANFDEAKRLGIVQLLAGRALGDVGGLESLCRIVRYDASDDVSKAAAAAILGMAGPEPQWWQQRAERIRKGVGASTRPATEWLRAAVATAEDPPIGLEQWDPLVKRELQWQQEAQESDGGYVVTLLQYQAAWLLRLERAEDASRVLLQIAENAQGQREGLVRLIHWAAKYRAWEVVPQLAVRFPEEFAKNPLLQYAHAEAEHVEGDEARAEVLGRQAFEASGDSHPLRFNTARHLQHLGLMRWVVPEWRELVRRGPPERIEVILASVRLAPLLHDREQYGEAADVLLALLDALDENLELRKKIGPQRSLLSLNPESLRANMYYYRALDAAREGRLAEQKDYLEQAVGADPFDGDVLIAMYRYKAADDSFRQRSRQLIHDALEHYESLISEDSEEPLHYNHYAWLVSNTEGDFEKATRYARQALESYKQETQTESAAILDTLAHCLYAQGHYAQAVAHQRRAVELEPHTGLIVRKLKFFEEALASSEGEASTPAPAS